MTPRATDPSSQGDIARLDPSAKANLRRPQPLGRDGWSRRRSGRASFPAAGFVVLMLASCAASPVSPNLASSQDAVPSQAARESATLGPTGDQAATPYEADLSPDFAWGPVPSEMEAELGPRSDVRAIENADGQRVAYVFVHFDHAAAEGASEIAAEFETERPQTVVLAATEVMLVSGLPGNLETAAIWQLGRNAVALYATDQDSARLLVEIILEGM